MKNFQFSTFNFQFTVPLLICLILLSTFYFLLSNSVLADEVPQQEEFVYLFHLYYDNGQLVADRDFEFKYDVIPEKYTAETLTTQFPFKGEIVGVDSQIISTFQFDPRRGNPNFVKGKISVKAPYAPNGQKAVFYDFQSRPLLTIFVSESSFCNDDGICNSERGEDTATCPNDCKEVVPTTTPPTTGEPPSGQTNILMIVIYVLIIAGAGLGGWYGWKWWKGRKELPPVQLPNNPNVQ